MKLASAPAKLTKYVTDLLTTFNLTYLFVLMLSRAQTNTNLLEQAASTQYSSNDSLCPLVEPSTKVLTVPSSNMKIKSCLKQKQNCSISVNE